MTDNDTYKQQEHTLASTNAVKSRKRQEDQQSFLDIYRNKRLYPFFQPILDFRSLKYIGVEGFIRGPEVSILHKPQALFLVAKQMGLQPQFEGLCRNLIFTEFAKFNQNGCLFLNVSINCLDDFDFLDGNTTHLATHFNILPKQIVLEITGTQTIDDFTTLQTLLHNYQQLGYRIAIDDFGEGASNLRLWSEIKPDFVKINQYFITGIAEDKVKFNMVRAICEMAASSHVAIIAEGIETEAELTVLRDLNIAYGQGDIIAEPQSVPQLILKESVSSILYRKITPVAAPIFVSETVTVTASTLLNPVEPIYVEYNNDEVFDRFEHEPKLLVLPVVDPDSKPIGLINRYTLIDRFARPFRRELFGKRSCKLFMNKTPIIVDHITPIQDIGRILSQAASVNMLDGFIITEHDRYIGVGSSQMVMAMVTEMQLRAARYANPLTGLPGNVPINETIERLLLRKLDFTACYCDLDHFKPYNDVYGYSRGDDLIQFLGEILIDVASGEYDFAGHIGGDDFMLLLQSTDWQQLLQQGIEKFDAGMQDFLDQQHILDGGYYGEDRKGNKVFHSIPALSIGCLTVTPGMFNSHHEISSAVVDTKKRAKKISGSNVFIERRLLTKYGTGSV